MAGVLSILIQPRMRLLQSPEIAAACALASRARTACAVVCVASSLALAFVVVGFRLFPFDLVPALAGAAAATFLLTAMLASRFGRLCSAEFTNTKKIAIAHFRKTSAACDAYYRDVKAQGRPFTRLDLAELRKRA